MGKYYPLGQYLKQSEKSSEILTYNQIISIIRKQLPPSAFRYREWWANDNSHTQAKEWLKVGWKVEHCILGKKVIFYKNK